MVNNFCAASFLAPCFMQHSLVLRTIKYQQRALIQQFEQIKGFTIWNFKHTKHQASKKQLSTENTTVYKKMSTIFKSQSQYRN